MTLINMHQKCVLLKANKVIAYMFWKILVHEGLEPVQTTCKVFGDPRYVPLGHPIEWKQVEHNFPTLKEILEQPFIEREEMVKNEEKPGI